MVYWKILILLCTIEIISTSYCKRKYNTHRFVTGYNQWNNVANRLYSSKTLHCKNTHKYPDATIDTNTSDNKPESIILTNNLIENLNRLYFQLVDTSEVVYLRINSCRIRSIESDAFKALNRGLINIFIKNTRISHVSQFAFNNLNHLKSLTLMNIGLDKTEDDFFNGTDSLRWLDLSYNEFTHVPVFNCHELQRFEINSNRLKDFSDVNNCSKLLYLIVSYNSIESLPNEGFLIEDLLLLHMNNNNINNISAYHLQRLNKLEELYVHDNPLFENADVPVNLFQNNLKLKKLDLSSTGIRKLENGTFSNLYHLRILWLRNNKLKHLPESIFEDLNSLKRLYLNSNELHSIENLGLKNVFELNLDSNNLTYFDNDTFASLPNLGYLSINNNDELCFRDDNISVPDSVNIYGKNDNC